MPKGIFSQGVCVLTTRTIAIEEIGQALASFQVRGYRQAAPDGSWQFGGPSLVIDYRPDINGKVVVDTVGQPWPDSMGDPKSDSITFGAWSFGQFGPFAFPGGLERAGQQCWNWQPGKTIAQNHTGFIRIRSSYVLGQKEDSVCLPSGYDSRAAVDEMFFLLRVAQAIMKVSGSLCYYNPNGEVLRDAESLQSMLQYCESHQFLPLPAWCNTRFFNLGDEWLLMDTVGNGQLETPDLEAVFRSSQHAPEKISNYLLNVGLHLVNSPAVQFKDGESIDGPNETNLTWRIRVPQNPLCPPPRRVCRLYRHADSAELAALFGEKW